MASMMLDGSISNSIIKAATYYDIVLHLHKIRPDILDRTFMHSEIVKYVIMYLV